MFEIGNYVVCPGHGVGQILNLETKNLGDEEKIFYIVKIISNGMTIMVPSDKKDGLRELVSDNEVNDVFNRIDDLFDLRLQLYSWIREEV